MTLAGRLRARWDIDPETQASLSFDRAIAIINLRRIELACLLAFATRALELWLGAAVPMTAFTLPLTVVLALLARLIQRSTSLRLQQAGVVAFILVAMANAIWTTIEVSRYTGYVGAGYLTNLLSLTMLFVLRPRTTVIVFPAVCALYLAALFQAPPVGGFKAMATASAVIGSAIGMIASWLIYSARASDDQQKRIIRAQNMQLNARDHERDQLMAITAHDLRSPLYGLRNLLDLAARRAVDGTSQVGAMRDAVYGLDSMIALVSRLLDAHSAEHEPLTARVNEDLRVHLLAAARRIKPAADAAGIAVAVDLPERPLVVTFDSVALSRILDNLLANAIRFSPPDVPVRLGCAVADGLAVLSVEDRGPGFDAAGRAAMFAKFHPRRGDVPAGAKAGTGMGLFIAASFAARMGARLEHASLVPTGTRFSLRVATGSPS